MLRDFVAGDILHTTNGDFLIVKIESHNNKDENDTYVGYGAIYTCVKSIYSFEMQYMSKDMNTLIDNIEKDGKIINVTKINRVGEESKMKDELVKDCARPDYEGEYWRNHEEIKRLMEENAQLKEALLKLALRL